MSEKTFFLYDLHVHRSDKQSADDMVRKAKEGGFKSFGIVHNVALGESRTTTTCKGISTR